MEELKPKMPILDLRWISAVYSLQKIKSSLENRSFQKEMSIRIHSYSWPELEGLLAQEGLTAAQRDPQKMNTELVIRLVRKTHAS